MNTPGAAGEARGAVGREIRRAAAAIVAGATLLLLLVLGAHRIVAASEERENEFHRRATALADRLHLTLRTVPVAAEPARDDNGSRPRGAIAFEAEAERAFGAALAIAEDLADLHRRRDGEAEFARAMARLGQGVKGLEALRTRHEGDRARFARAVANADTYMEVVALQLRRQHEAAILRLVGERRTLITGLEVAAVLVGLAVVFGTARYVRLSFRAIDRILDYDERRSVQLAESLAARESALREKEVLLKEVYHRVKNNLQVVSSLLNMQGREVRDPEALRLFDESANRVRAMALVHEQLYRSEDLGKISCRAFLEELGARLAEAYAPHAGSVRLLTRAGDLELGLESAIPSALIVNELIANAYRHAFAPGTRGTVEATMERLDDGRVRIAVHDDGRGLPPGFRAESASTLGMRIVVTLARQLGGELTCSEGSGTRCEVVFRPPDEARRPG